MIPLIYQIVIPFVLSAVIVVGISIIAEKFGTKLGGIIGTLPSTIVIAFIFISLNKGTSFASDSAAVVPAEMGINIIFLFMFAVMANRRLPTILISTLGVWSVLSVLLYIFDFNNIYISIIIYLAMMILALIILEKVIKVKSVEKKEVEYTKRKILFRGVLAGIVIAVAVTLSNIGSVLSGIFSVFPAIFLSTMLIFTKEHGPKFVGGIAKSMIFGTPTVVSYAIALHFLYPEFGMVIGTVLSYIISLGVVTVLLKSRYNLN